MIVEAALGVWLTYYLWHNILSKKFKSTVVGGTLAIICILLAAGFGIFSYFGIISNPTVMSFNTMGVITQGDASFVVSMDKFGLNTTNKIYWGTVNPLENNSVKMYIRNTGSSPMVITWNTTNWKVYDNTSKVISSTDEYFITGVQNIGTSIQPGRVREITVTLMAKSNIPIKSRSFEYDLWIIGNII